MLWGDVEKKFERKRKCAFYGKRKIMSNLNEMVITWMNKIQLFRDFVQHEWPSFVEAVRRLALPIRSTALKSSYYVAGCVHSGTNIDEIKKYRNRDNLNKLLTKGYLTYLIFKFIGSGLYAKRWSCVVSHCRCTR